MPGGDRSRANQALIDGLVNGRQVAQVAADVGVSESTVWRRLHDPDFQALLAEARTRRADRIADRAAGYVDASLGQLARYLVDDATNPHLGMTPGQFHLRRIQATWVLVRLHLACRQTYKDEEVRQLRQLLEGLEREVELFHSLYGLQEEGGGHEHRWPQAQS